MPRDFEKAAHVGELSPGDKKLVLIGDERVVLANVGGSYYAVEEECTHAYGRLSMGQLYGEELMCPVHGAAFDVRTGAALSPPACEGLRVYPVRVEGDDILIGPPGV